MIQKKRWGVDKVGTTEEYECLIMFDFRRIARSMAEKMVDEVDECFLHRRPQWNPQH